MSMCSLWYAFSVFLSIYLLADPTRFAGTCWKKSPRTDDASIFEARVQKVMKDLPISYDADVDGR